MEELKQLIDPVLKLPARALEKIVNDYISNAPSKKWTCSLKKKVIQ